MFKKYFLSFLFLSYYLVMSIFFTAVTIVNTIYLKPQLWFDWVCLISSLLILLICIYCFVSVLIITIYEIRSNRRKNDYD